MIQAATAFAIEREDAFVDLLVLVDEDDRAAALVGLTALAMPSRVLAADLA